MFANRFNKTEQILLLGMLICALGCSAITPKINLIENGSFEPAIDLNPIIIKPADYLSSADIQIPDGSNTKGVYLKPELNLWEYVEIRYPLQPGEYQIKVKYYGDSADGPSQAIQYNSKGHHTIFELRPIGDKQYHIVEGGFTATDNVVGLVIKKVSSKRTSSNPIVEIVVTPVFHEEIPDNWHKERLPGSLVSWSFTDKLARTGKYALLIDDAVGGSGGWNTDLVSVTEGEYELSAWIKTNLLAEDTKIEAGLRWYGDGRTLLSQDAASISQQEDWQQIRLSLKAPKGAKYAQFYLLAQDLFGSVALDDVKLLGEPISTRPSTPTYLSIPPWGRIVGKFSYIPQKGFQSLYTINIGNDLYINSHWNATIHFSGIGAVNRSHLDPTVPENRLHAYSLALNRTIMVPIFGRTGVFAIRVGNLDVNYSPYIASMGMTEAGGWQDLPGVAVSWSGLGIDGRMFSSWNRDRTLIVGGQIPLYLGKLETNLISLFTWDQNRTLVEETPRWELGSIKEKASSIDFNYNLYNCNIDGVYAWVNNFQEPISDMWRLQFKPVLGISNLNAFFEIWFCDPKFNPLHGNKGEEGWDELYERYIEQNWVSKHLGQRGYTFSWGWANKEAQFNTTLDWYYYLNDPSGRVMLETEFDVSRSYQEYKLWVNLKQGHERRSIYEVNQYNPYWQEYHVGLERQLTPLFSVQYLRDFEDIHNLKVNGQELRLVSHKGDNRFFIGIRKEEFVDGLIFKLGGFYKTPGGINVKFAFTNPGQNIEEHWDFVRDRWVEMDNGIITSLYYIF